MTQFWIATAVVIVIALLVLILPMLKSQQNNDETLRDELNKAFYKDRLSELKAEENAGLVGDQQELIVDLKQSLLDDIPQAEPLRTEKAAARRTWMIAVPSSLVVIGLSYGLYFSFGGSQQMAHWQQVQQDLPALSAKLMAPKASLSPDEINDLMLALRTHLHDAPNDLMGWQLLGRMGIATQNVPTAIGAMQRAYTLKPDDKEVVLGYAQALMLSPEAFEQEKAYDLLTQLHQTSALDSRVLSLLAFNAFKRQDYAEAIDYWTQIQKTLSPKDADYAMLERSINSAKKQMGRAVASEQSVSVKVSLGSMVQPQEGAVLIVSVHSLDGIPMPIAAARYPLGHFPRTIVLDDNDNLTADRRLSEQEQVVVRVRLDNDGNVSTHDGDWKGESTPVKLGDSVAVEINQPDQ